MTMSRKIGEFRLNVTDLSHGISTLRYGTTKGDVSRRGQASVCWLARVFKRSLKFPGLSRFFNRIFVFEVPRDLRLVRLL
jgi:hypothetical protein